MKGSKGYLNRSIRPHLTRDNKMDTCLYLPCLLTDECLLKRSSSGVAKIKVGSLKSFISQRLRFQRLRFQRLRFQRLRFQRLRFQSGV